MNSSSVVQGKSPERCDRAVLSTLADGRLEPAMRDRVEAHLRACAACGADFETAAEGRRAIRATATFPVPSQQAYFRLRYAVAARQRRRILTAAVVAVLVALVSAWLTVAALWAFFG